MSRSLLLAGALFLLIGLLVAAWTIAKASGRSWLRPGHGPLWFLASVANLLLFGALHVVSGPREPHEWLASLPFVGTTVVDDVSTDIRHVALALLGLIVCYLIARLLFSYLRPRERYKAPVPTLFIIGGIAPDGSQLVHFRLIMQWLCMLMVVLGWAAAFRAEALGGDTVGWAYALATALGCLFGFTHPSEPLPEERREAQRERVQSRPDLQYRVRNLHAWLGSPRLLNHVQATRTDAQAESTQRSFGLTPYTYQARLLENWPQRVAMSGPEGSGRSTTAFMLGVGASLDHGSTVIVVTTSHGSAEQLSDQLEQCLESVVEKAALRRGTGHVPAELDLWIVPIDTLERYLDAQASIPRTEFLRRLELVVIEDVERHSGPGIARLRFLVHRLGSVRADRMPRMLLIGNLGEEALREATRRVLCEEDVQIVSTDGVLSPDGARSLRVDRYLVAHDRIDKAMAGGASAGNPEDRIARFFEHDDLAGEVFGTDWRTARRPRDGGDLEVRVCRVGPSSAFQVLARNRGYAGPGTHAIEYLTFAGDPMSRLLERRFEQGRPWPKWYDHKRYPRVLSGVPGGKSTPGGIERIARRQLRAALDEAFHPDDRLSRVFSPEIVKQEKEAIKESGALHESLAWFPAPEMSWARTLRLFHSVGALRELDRTEGHERSVLRDRDAGTTIEVDTALLDIDYYRGAVFTDRESERRYRIDYDPTDRGTRYIKPAEPGTSAPIRRLQLERVDEQPVYSVRFQGSSKVGSMCGRVKLKVEHFGARTFRLNQERHVEEREPRPIQVKPLTTWARLMVLETADPVILHTLSHVFREILDYFYLRASDCLGVTYATAEETGVPDAGALVFYDRHPGGLGFVQDIDSRTDFHMLLQAARAILRGCDCAQSCANCCQSTTCTMHVRCDLLDRHATLAVLDAVLGSTPAGGLA